VEDLRNIVAQFVIKREMSTTLLPVEYVPNMYNDLESVCPDHMAMVYAYSSFVEEGFDAMLGLVTEYGTNPFTSKYYPSVDDLYIDREKGYFRDQTSGSWRGSDYGKPTYCGDIWRSLSSGRRIE
jgi:hypothetical protein